MKRSDREEILSLVERPSRYIGGEVNAARKNRAGCVLSFALAFPDTYEVGMSHLGLQILYAVLNGDPEVIGERCYAPWPDMERAMREHGVPLCSLESGTPLESFDIIGFSLQYELSYTNVLNMLELGGIPVRRDERMENDPLVIAGGPCAFNPEPMADFMDAFVIGEGEEVLSEICHALKKAKKKGSSRESKLHALAEIPGIYVPAVHQPEERIKKRIIADLDRWLIPLKPLVPSMNAIHNRVVLEVARGCTRGCRFCQAGMVWRPVRERSPAVIEKMAQQMLAATGYEELTLLSLSAGDYSFIDTLLKDLMDRYCRQKVAIGLPSLRTETLSRNLMEEIKRVRKTSFTLAPEAGTQRLRNVINKGNTEEDLLRTVGSVFEAGWRSVKLYFMTGIPGEREEDLEGIVDLAYKVLREGKYRNRVTAAVSTFVPKSHTPFQWVRQAGFDEISEKQAFFKRRMIHKNLMFKWHDSRMSLLEGILSRGDQRLGVAVERAFRLGCRFDGWSDALKFDLWERAFRETGIRQEDYLRERGFGETLPWHVIDTGIKTEFLLKERDLSFREELTPDCRTDRCRDCGVCDKTITGIQAAPKSDHDELGMPENPSDKNTVTIRRWRVRFAKEGLSRFLSHLEVSSALIRAIRHSGLRLNYSEGFHPHPKISFACATPVGLESREEFVDIQIEDHGLTREGMAEKINNGLPEGLKILDIREIYSPSDSLSRRIRGYVYESALPADPDHEGMSLIEGRMQSFLTLPEFVIQRRRKDGDTEKDVRPLVESLVFDRTDGKLVLALLSGEKGNVRPVEILVHVLGLDEAVAKSVRIVKTGTLFAEAGETVIHGFEKPVSPAVEPLNG
jgi:radical SAM family uncharacterized protein/radical SAM-linked protein